MNDPSTTQSAQWYPLNLEDWRDGNGFSPMHPLTNFSPRLWGDDGVEQNEAHLTGSSGSLFADQLFSYDNIFPAPDFAASGTSPIQDHNIAAEIIR